MAEPRDLPSGLESVSSTVRRHRIRSEATNGALDVGSSDLAGRVVVLVGAPRSGTTWLQQMIAGHPRIATSGESHVLCEGVGALLDNHENPNDTLGLRTWIAKSDLVASCRSVVDRVYSSVLASDPEATHVLDKTPLHEPYARHARSVLPDATYIHLIRDGRDVGASAFRLWRGARAWGTPREAGLRWRAAVLDARDHLADLDYIEVRYERLATDPADVLTGIWRRIGVLADADLVDAVVEFARPPVNTAPAGPRRRASRWAPAEVEREIVSVAGDLLEDLGYIDSAEHAAIRRRISPRIAMAVARGRLEQTRDRVAAAAGARYERRRQTTRAAATRLLDAAFEGHVEGAATDASRDVLRRLHHHRLGRLDVQPGEATAEVIGADGGPWTVRLVERGTGFEVEARQ